MAIYAVRKGNESNESLMQRFKKQVQQKGDMKLLRSRSRHHSKPNKRLVRMRAIKREWFRTKNRKKQFYSNM